MAEALGFARPEAPVTYTQHSRGRAELAYVTALEGLALDVGKLTANLWLFGTDEFGFCSLPVELTTGSSLMPHKRNPDVLELARAHCRQIVADRAALLDVLRDLPSGYHPDFQLLSRRSSVRTIGSRRRCRSSHACWGPWSSTRSACASC